MVETDSVAKLFAGPCELCGREDKLHARCHECSCLVCSPCSNAFDRAYAKLRSRLIHQCPKIECQGSMIPLALYGDIAKQPADEKKKEDTAADSSKEIRLEILLATDPERKRIVDMFHKTVDKPRTTIGKVFRIVNKPLLTIFEACKARMDREGRKIGKTEVGANEKLLFHGTTRVAAGGIVREGFDMRRAGQANGTALGPGAYFAADAATSMSYTHTDGHGGLSMLVCRVLVGEPKRDAVHSGNVFVVNREQQILPVFLLHLSGAS